MTRGRSMYGGGLSLLDVHEKPGSIVHVAEQPSPEMVLPSSHCSGGSRMPSPQRDTHAPTGFVAVPQVTGRVQSGLHWPYSPVLSAVPLSHCSDPWTLPSPHTVAVQTPPGVQTKPGSS